MGIRDGRRLLDAGCGLGEEARELAGLVGPSGEVTAIDSSKTLVALAQQRDTGSVVRYAVGDISLLDFPDATFHAVRSERVIQHVPDPDTAVAELVRVTVPGGRVCLVDTDWESFLTDGVPAEYIGSFRRLAHDKGSDLKPAGRLLRGQLVRAGLTAVTAEPFAIPITDRHTAELMSPVFNRRVLDQMLNAPKNLMDPWFSAFDDALARDEFLAVLTIWVVAGTKPT
jgi:SAM-dependent methyltransferase